jgi:hypothetical protein
LQGDGRLRTTPGERCVLAHQGWAGEKSDIFSILLTSMAKVAKKGPSKAPNIPII